MVGVGPHFAGRVRRGETPRLRQDELQRPGPQAPLLSNGEIHGNRVGKTEVFMRKYWKRWGKISKTPVNGGVNEPNGGGASHVW